MPELSASLLPIRMCGFCKLQLKPEIYSFYIELVRFQYFLFYICAKMLTIQLLTVMLLYVEYATSFFFANNGNLYLFPVALWRQL